MSGNAQLRECEETAFNLRAKIHQPTFNWDEKRGKSALPTQTDAASFGLAHSQGQVTRRHKITHTPLDLQLFADGGGPRPKYCGVYATEALSHEG